MSLAGLGAGSGATRPLQSRRWVRESAFGRWFTGSEIWRKYVVRESVERLAHLAPQFGTRHLNGRFLDLGSGSGAAFKLLDDTFQPREIVGIDIDPAGFDQARKLASGCRCPVVVMEGTAYELPLADHSVDVVFSHQLLHHVTDHAGVMAEIYRVLAPGGLLLMCESSDVFIRLWWVRWFFRHPEEGPMSADAYLHLARAHGFELPETAVQRATPWWSDAWYGLRDGARRQWLAENPAEVYAVARKPLAQSDDTSTSSD